MDTCLEPSPCRQDHLFARLRQAPFVPAMDHFFLSHGYFILISQLTVIANAFGLELLVYGIFVAFAVYICFFGKDFLPIIPLAICCYVVPSRDNNPGINDESIFYAGSGGTAIMVMAIVLIVCVLLRLALDPEIGQLAFLKAERKLLPGILVLGAAYLLAGAGSGHYFDHGYGNLLFAALQFLAVGLLYYIFCGAVKWKEAPSHYFGWVGVTVGFVLTVEIFVVYLIADPIVDNEIDRNLIYTGWGNYNNMGAMLAMAIPFAFQTACVRRHSWVYNLCGALFLSGVILTCSRTSVLFALAIYAVSTVMLFLKSRNRRVCVRTNVITFAILAAIVAIWYRDVFWSYLEIFGITRSITSRFDGFEEGIAQFLSAPIFGAGFYATDCMLEEWSSVEAFTSFFPARWHNTVIQLAASCGVAGLLAYGFHRLQTIRLIWKKPTIPNIFIGISIAALLLTSLFDCHFFNIGPTLFYSMALAFAEKHDPDRK